MEQWSGEVRLGEGNLVVTFLMKTFRQSAARDANLGLEGSLVLGAPSSKGTKV